MLLICNLIFNQLNIISTDTYKIRFSDDGYTHLNEQVVQNNYTNLYVLVDENTKKFCLTKFTEKMDLFNFSFVLLKKN